MITSTPAFTLTLLFLLSHTTNPLTEPLLDPSRILEHLPFDLARVDSPPPLYPATAPVNWKETLTAHEISIDVPGMKNEELKIEVLDERRILRVSGERKRDAEENKGEKWHRVERAERFWRQFRVPDNVDLEAVRAKLEDGVLTVVLPKVAVEKVKGPRAVRITGGDVGTERLNDKDVGKKIEL